MVSRFFLLCALGPAVSIAQTLQYTIQDLGQLQDGQSANGVAGINIAGEVVGFMSIGGQIHAFRTAPNSAINPATDDLGTLGGTMSVAHGINSLGQVVGWSLTGTGETHGFRTSPNAPINPAADDIGSLGGTFTQVFAINDSGQVTGSSAPSGASPLQAFRTAPNRPINPMTDNIATLLFCSSASSCVQGPGAMTPNANSYSAGQNINGAGDVSGYFHNPGLAYNTGFAFVNGSVRVLPFVFAPMINFVGITNQDEVAGNLASDRNLTVWQDGTVTTLASGCLCSPFAINNSLEVIGQAEGFQGVPSHPFLAVKGTVYNLTALIPPNSGWTFGFGAAAAINDVGQIAGIATLNGQLHAFRMDPVLSPQQAIEQILSFIQSLGLNMGESQALSVTIRQAIAAWSDGDTQKARNLLNAFENKVNAQAGKQLSTEQANALIAEAEWVMRLL